MQVKADKAKAWKIENEQLREEIKERNLNYEERWDLSRNSKCVSIPGQAVGTN